MNQFKSSAELKASAREHLLGHYGVAVGAYLIMGSLVCAIAFAITFIVDLTTVTGTVIYYASMFLVSVLMGLFVSGICYLYLKISCGRPVSVGDLFYGFQLCPDKAIIMQARLTLITYIATLPQIVIGYMINKITLDEGMVLALTERQLTQLTKYLVPFALSFILAEAVSVILGLIYAQAFYLLHDFPQYSAAELLKKSRRLMVHHKGRLFYLNVSFIPLFLLGILSFGLAFLWILPYMTATETEFFLDLIKNNTEAAV